MVDRSYCAFKSVQTETIVHINFREILLTTQPATILKTEREWQPNPQHKYSDTIAVGQWLSAGTVN